MGADMCMMMVSHRQGVVPNFDKAVRYIENLRLSDLSKTKGDDPFEDIYFDEALGFENDPKALEEVQSILRDAVQAVINNLDARDVSMWNICGFTCYFTGGMTSGDNPTDSYSDFSRIWECGVLGEEAMNAAGFEWPPTGPDTFHINEEASLTDV